MLATEHILIDISLITDQVT